MSHTDASVADGSDSQVARSTPAPPAPPPDEENPAIIDARKTFVITMVGSALFVGAILFFIL